MTTNDVRTCDLCGDGPVFAEMTDHGLDDYGPSIDLCERCTVGLIVESMAAEYIASQLS